MASKKPKDIINKNKYFCCQLYVRARKVSTHFTQASVSEGDKEIFFLVFTFF
jgi:hypothetical protein